MNQNEPEPEADDRKRKRGLIVLLAVVFLSATTAMIYWYKVQPIPKSVASDLVIKKDTTSAARSAIITYLPQDTFAKPSVISKTAPPMTLAEEIALLNKDGSVPFENPLYDGTTTEGYLSDYFHKTADGYTLDLQGTSFLTTPTYYDSSLFVSGGFSSRAFYAFDAAGGAMKWAAALSDDGPSSCVTADSLVIFNTESCTVFALNRHTGHQLWSKWIGDPLMTHLVTDGECVFTAYPSMTFWMNPQSVAKFTHIRPSHAIAAMKAQTGEVKWQRWLDGDIMTSPVLCGEEILLTTFSGTLYKIRKSDGKILAAANLNATTLPTISHGKIYLAQRHNGTDGRIKESIVEVDKEELKVLRTLATQDAPYLNYKLLKKAQYKEDCHQLDMRNGFGQTPGNTGWEKASRLIGQSNVSSLQNFMGSTMVADKGKLFSCYGKELVCLDIDSGKILWSYQLPGDMYKAGSNLATAPLISGDYVVTVTLSGDVLVINKNTGKLDQTYATGKAVRNQPIIVSDKIFVPTEQGELVRIDSKRKDLTDWTMFMKNNAHNTTAE